MKACCRRVGRCGTTRRLTQHKLRATCSILSSDREDPSQLGGLLSSSSELLPDSMSFTCHLSNLTTTHLSDTKADTHTHQYSNAPAQFETALLSSLSVQIFCLRLTFLWEQQIETASYTKKGTHSHP